MKIRIYNDSIRLRLDRSEVEQIGAGQTVACSTRFPMGPAFGYRLNTGTCSTPRAQFSDAGIEIQLPSKAAQDWAEDETAVSIVGEQPVPDGTLHLLIEKDFECLDPRAGEDQSNRFRNPKAS